MSEAIGLLDAPIVLRLSLALVHFVWQGAVVAAIALLVLAALRRAAAAARYVALLVVFAAMAACPVVTFAVLPGPAEPMPAGVSGEPATAAALPVTAALVAAVEVAPAPPLPWPERARSEGWPTRLGSAWEWLESRLSWVAAVWMVGVVALSLRLLVGWGRMARSRRRGAEVGVGRLGDAVAALSARLGVSRPVRLLESAAARVPTVIGWLRPVVLLPTSALAGLTPEQLEAVIAHELAHVRRHDYLVNLAQTVVETLLFYHPAVWWLSSRIRAEREHCCDDLAVALCGDAAGYARALTELEGLRAPQPAVASVDGSLSSRVRRILGVSRPRGGHAPSGLAALFALGGLVVAAIALGVSAQRCAAGADKMVGASVEGRVEAVGTRGARIRADLDTVAEPGEEIATSAEAEAQEEDGEATEGPTIRRIQFEGLRGLTADQLLAVMETKPGDPCDNEVLVRDTRAIENLYRSRGYVLVTASVLLVSDDGGLTLTMRVLEGEIEDIVVRGVDDQQAAAVLKSISTKVGDVYNDEVVMRELAEIGSLGWVESVRRDVEVGSQPGKMILVFIVTPREAAVSEGGADSREVVYAIINLEHMPAGYVGSLFYPKFKLEAGWPALGGGGPSGALAELLPPGIRFISATRYDSWRLLVAGTPEAIADLRHLIAMLDKEPQQVLVEWRAWPGRPAPLAAIELHDLDKQASGDYDVKIGYASDASGDAIARAFPSAGPCAAARIALLNLAPGFELLPQVGGLPAILLHLLPRINGDGTVTMTLALVPMDRPDEPSFALMPQDAELLATVNVNSGEGFVIVLSKGGSAMTILIEPTILDAP